MVNDGEEVGCSSYLLSHNSRSKGCPEELKINKIKPDTGEFYIPNKILVGMPSPCETFYPKFFWRLKR